MTEILILGSEGQVGSGLKEVLTKFRVPFNRFDITLDESHDLTDISNNLLKNYTQRASYVVFLAYDVGGSGYLKKYENTFKFIENNMKIMTNVFSVLNESKIPFIFASSQMSNMNFSTYGVLKAIGEKASHSLNGKVIKFWNVYGEEKDFNKNHVITDFIDSAIKYKKIECRTDGTEVRQFLHSFDAGMAIKEIIFNDMMTDNEYHITSFNDTKIMDLTQIIKEIFIEQYNIKIDISFSNKKDEVQFDKRNSPENKILKYWQPNIELKEGLKIIIEKRLKYLDEN